MRASRDHSDTGISDPFRRTGDGDKIPQGESEAESKFLENAENPCQHKGRRELCRQSTGYVR